jgi:Holliday junction resolvase RusA-like endonuclease
MFDVVGLPAPQGSKTRMPNGALLEGASATGRKAHKAWRQSVAEVARELAEDRPFDGALTLDVVFRFPMPQRAEDDEAGHRQVVAVHVGRVDGRRAAGR